MQNKKISFENDDGQSLSGVMALPNTAPRAYALFAHCFTCSKDLKATARISRALVERGIAVLRFDFTGLGQSEGDFADTNFSSNVSDLVAAVRFLEARRMAAFPRRNVTVTGEVPSGRVLKVPLRGNSTFWSQRIPVGCAAS